MVDVTPVVNSLYELLEAALILTVTWVINFLFGRIVIRAVWNRNRSVAYEIGSVGGIVIWTAGVLLTLPVLGASDTVVSVVILLVGAFLILATREFTGNWFAGQTIKRIIPFKVGDWIKTSGSYGRVARIDDLYTTLITPLNESVMIPNSRLTSETILDRSANGGVKVPLEVEVPAGVDLAVVTVTMSDILHSLTGKFSEVGEDEQPEVHLVAQSKTEFKVRVFVTIANPAREEEVKSEFMKAMEKVSWPQDADSDQDSKV